MKTFEPVEVSEDGHHMVIARITERGDVSWGNWPNVATFLERMRLNGTSERLVSCGFIAAEATRAGIPFDPLPFRAIPTLKAEALEQFREIVLPTVSPEGDRSWTDFAMPEIDFQEDDAGDVSPDADPDPWGDLTEGDVGDETPAENPDQNDHDENPAKVRERFLEIGAGYAAAGETDHMADALQEPIGDVSDLIDDLLSPARLDVLSTGPDDLPAPSATVAERKSKRTLKGGLREYGATITLSRVISDGHDFRNIIHSVASNEEFASLLGDFSLTRRRFSSVNLELGGISLREKDTLKVMRYLVGAAVPDLAYANFILFKAFGRYNMSCIASSDDEAERFVSSESMNRVLEALSSLDLV